MPETTPERLAKAIARDRMQRDMPEHMQNHPHFDGTFEVVWHEQNERGERQRESYRADVRALLTELMTMDLPSFGANPDDCRAIFRGMIDHILSEGK